MTREERRGGDWTGLDWRGIPFLLVFRSAGRGFEVRFRHGFTDLSEVKVRVGAVSGSQSWGCYRVSVCSTFIIL